VVGSIDWSDIPGYNTILKTILVELEERDLHFYPDALKETTRNFIYNEKLLGTFVKIVFRKTNAYDIQTVFKTLDMIVMWFKQIHNNHDIVHPEFDYAFFYEGIGKLLKLEFANAQAKCIWMLYQITHIIPAL